MVLCRLIVTNQLHVPGRSNSHEVGKSAAPIVECALIHIIEGNLGNDCLPFGDYDVVQISGGTVAIVSCLHLA